MTTADRPRAGTRHPAATLPPWFDPMLAFTLDCTEEHKGRPADRHDIRRAVTLVLEDVRRGRARHAIRPRTRDEATGWEPRPSQGFRRLAAAARAADDDPTETLPDPVCCRACREVVGEGCRCVAAVANIEGGR